MAVYKIKDLQGTMLATAFLDSDFVYENRDSICDRIVKQIEDAGHKAIINKEQNMVEVEGATDYFMLPKLKRVRVGKITFRSKDFIFEYTNIDGEKQKSYCDIPPKENMTDNGFFTVNYKMEKTYWTLLRN